MEGGAEIPDSVIVFRDIVNRIKKNLLENENNTGDLQDVSKMKEILKRIQQFGNIIHGILDKKVSETEDFKSVFALFKNNKFHIDRLSEEELELCKHYIKVDIFMYPYTISTDHTDDIKKST
jgi:hypothetical protein